MKDTILNIVRSVLIAAGGFMVGKGWIDSEALNNGVAAVITLVGVIWAAIAQKKALNTPVPATAETAK